jgi:hypothetical protein
MPSAKGEIEFVITVTNPIGTEKAVKRIVGSIDEIQTAVDNLNTSSFGKQLDLTTENVQNLQQAFKANKKVIAESGGGFLTQTRTAKNFFKVIQNGVSQFRKLGNLGQVLKKPIFGDQAARAATEVTKFQRATKGATLTTGALGRQLNASFTKQQTALVNQYTSKISALQTKQKLAGDASGATAKRIQLLTQQLAILKAARVTSVVPGVGPQTQAELKQAEGALKSFFAKKKGIFSGISSASLGGSGTGGSKIGADLRKTGAQLSGALGFGLVTAGIEVQQLFRDKRLKNQLTTGAKTIAQNFGNIFGSAIGSILGDIGSAFGNLAEVMINAVTFQIRLVGSAVGAAIRGVGLLVISGFFAGITAGAAGLGLVPVFAALLVPLAFSILTLINDLVNELTDIISKLFKSVVSIVSAGLKTVVLVIKTGLKILFKIWTALWTSLKDIVKTTFKAIGGIVALGIKLIIKLTQQGARSFLQLQQGATRAAKELANQGDKVAGIIAEINSIRVNFGFEKADTAQAFFNTISAGFRTTAERIRITGAASKLALADQSSLANATNALITVYANYGEKLSDVEKISRLLSTATTIGVTSVEELGPALKSVVGIAKFSKVGLEDLLASVSALTQVFGKGSTKSVTKFFSRFIEAIANPTSRSRKEFEKLGVSIRDLQGGNFSDKFVNLLEKLKNIQPGQLRDFFPTVQARRAFAGLTDNVDRYRTILQQIRKLNNIQGKQTQLIFTKAFQRVKQLAEITKIAKERFGELFFTVAGLTVLSDKLFKVILSIGNALSSGRLTSSLTRIGELISLIAKPIETLILAGLRKVDTIVKSIASKDIFQSDRLVVLAQNLFGVVKTVSTWIAKLGIVDKIWAGILTTGDLINKTFDKIRETIDKVSSGKLNFFDVREELEKLASIAENLTFDFATRGINKFTEGVLFVNDLLLNLTVPNLNFTEQQQRLVDAFAIAFDSIELLARNAWTRLLNDILLEAKDELFRANDIFAKSLKDTLNTFITIARWVDFITANLFFWGHLLKEFAKLATDAPGLRFINKSIFNEDDPGPKTASNFSQMLGELRAAINPPDSGSDMDRFNERLRERRIEMAQGRNRVAQGDLLQRTQESSFNALMSIDNELKKLNETETAKAGREALNTIQDTFLKNTREIQMLRKRFSDLRRLESQTFEREKAKFRAGKQDKATTLRNLREARQFFAGKRAAALNAAGPVGEKFALLSRQAARARAAQMKRFRAGAQNEVKTRFNIDQINEKEKRLRERLFTQPQRQREAALKKEREKREAAQDKRDKEAKETLRIALEKKKAKLLAQALGDAMAGNLNENELKRIQGLLDDLDRPEGEKGSRGAKGAKGPAGRKETIQTRKAFESLTKEVSKINIRKLFPNAVKGEGLGAPMVGNTVALIELSKQVRMARKAQIKAMRSSEAPEGAAGLLGTSPGATGKTGRNRKLPRDPVDILVSAKGASKRAAKRAKDLWGQITDDTIRQFEVDLFGADALLRRGQGRTNNNPGFRNQQARTNRNVFTRSGRRQGTGRQGGVYTFPITAGVRRARRGESLFDRETASLSGVGGLGKRFQGQSALGILRGQRRRDGGISPLAAGVVNSKAQSDPTVRLASATDSNTEAVLNNNARVEANNTMVQANNTKLDVVSKKLEANTKAVEIDTALRKVPHGKIGGGIGAPPVDAATGTNTSTLTTE